MPQNDNANNNPLFPEAALVNDMDAGVNRAKLLWYNIASLGLNQADLDDPCSKTVQETEIFPNRQLPPFQQLSIFRTFDLTYFPSERGPYNFDVPGGTDYSPGIGFDGKLLNPEDRWAGVMRGLTTTDFEAANVEFLEFWMLDPGYSVTGTAASGAEALALAEETHPNLVFMDITIQGPIDGVETAERLSSRMDVPIIFLTAHTDTGTIVRARKARPYGFLVKPLEERELMTTIEMAISRHRGDVSARLIEQAISNAGVGIVTGERFRPGTPDHHVQLGL